MHNTMHGLREDVDTFYEYLHLLATQRLTPVTLTPNILHNLLHHVQEEIISNTCLWLAEDPDSNVWAFTTLLR